MWPEERARLKKGNSSRFNLRCKECTKAQKEDPDRHTRTDCCALRLLISQPDFQEQLSQLEERLTEHGITVFFFPKYHCELNYIEFLWGYSKRLVRESCDYTFDSLKSNVESSLKSCPLATIRRFERRMWKTIDLYNRPGVSTKLAMYALKKYRGHRMIPKFVVAEMDKAYQDSLQ